MSSKPLRRFPIGTEWRHGAVNLRVWAPAAKSVTAVIEGVKPTKQDPESQVTLEPEGNGYFSITTKAMRVGSLYRYRLDDGDVAYPDPASRYQPAGPHGPSQVVDPETFPWTDAKWPGVKATGQVIYELHIGTFSQAGTWKGAEEQLADLADLGITLIELMPINDFSGEFGWGYDGVNLFAPTRLYGPPDHVRSFVNRAHALGMGVILDVVYNHLGPDGNYLPQFAPEYFSDRYKTDWGAALNFEGPRAAPVREFVTTNAAYWIAEFHFDGLRLDATQNIYDDSPTHILSDIVQAAREAAGARTIYIVAENEEQKVKNVQPRSAGGYGIDSLWNDDLHHTALVALTGRIEAYYTDYRGSPQEFISAAKYGYLYQGQRYEWQKQNRGASSLRLDPSCFVTFLENHDQIANSGGGWRCHHQSPPGLLRAITAYLLLGPGTPMLFQGQEFHASGPFLYFADHSPELAQQVHAGRNEFLAQFPSLASPTVQARLADPGSRETFESSKLDWTERHSHLEAVQLHRDLLRLRREDPVLSNPQRPFDGAVLSASAFVLRFFAEDGRDRLLLVNLGKDLELEPVPEPLMAAPAGQTWGVKWSSESPDYGGRGVTPLFKDFHFYLPGNAALFLTPEVRDDSSEQSDSSPGQPRDE